MKVYIIDLERFVPDESAVSPYRLEKAGRLKSEAGRRLSLAAAKALDLALNDFGFCEKDMRYTESANGKPAFSGCPLQFSLSHSGHYACAAVAPFPVGIDVQMLSKCDLRVAERCFDASELETLKSSPDLNAAFTRLWSQHESAVKLTGEGLSGMKAVDLSRFAFRFYELYDAALCVCTENPCNVSFICQ